MTASVAKHKGASTAIITETLENPFLVHCVGGCSRGHWRNLAGQHPDDVRCEHCGGDKIAIWRHEWCLYAHSGRVEYPMGTKSKFGEKVRGPGKRSKLIMETRA